VRINIADIFSRSVPRLRRTNRSSGGTARTRKDAENEDRGGLMRRHSTQLKWMMVGMALLSLLVLASGPVFAHADTHPIDVIKSGTDQALTLLRSSCKPGEVFIVREHRDEILKIVYSYFDFAEMSKSSLGPHWKSQAPVKQQEFVTIFEQLLFNTYLDRAEIYTCSNEKVLYDNETIEGSSAVVKTRVTGYKEKDVAIDYRLRLKDGQWKVYDVVVEGISLVNNYRQQFNAILTKESFDGLLKRMQEKLAAPKE
jgi:phospholipid transport system substrate-binding protein